jgi:hypothetical protein
VVARGDVVWLELEQEGRRPVLVLTRDEAIPRLRNIVVALITRTIRGIDSEVETWTTGRTARRVRRQPRQPPHRPTSAPDRADHPTRPHTHERDLPRTRGRDRLLKPHVVASAEARSRLLLSRLSGTPSATPEAEPARSRAHGAARTTIAFCRSDRHGVPGAGDPNGDHTMAPGRTAARHRWRRPSKSTAPYCCSS